MLKKLLIVLVVLVFIAALAGYGVYSRLDSIVKSAVEKYGTQATQTSVKLDSVKLSLASGAGELKGLTVGTPKGFLSPYTLNLGSISVKVDINSIRGTGPIVINEIIVDKAQVAYEILSSGQSNMQTLAHNAEQYTGSSAQKTDQKVDASKGKPERKVIIKSLVISNGQISISQPLLAQPISSNLPTITLTDIGKDGEGVSPAKVAEQVLEAITSSAGRVAAVDLRKQLGSQLNNLNTTGGVKDLGNKLKGMFGGSK